MITALRARPEPDDGTAAHLALHRRPDRRKRTAEKVLAGLLLFLVFAVTVVLLGLQWLGNQNVTGYAPVPTTGPIISEVQPS
jgi:hypothetical protein